MQYQLCVARSETHAVLTCLFYFQLTSKCQELQCPCEKYPKFIINIFAMIFRVMAQGKEQEIAHVTAGMKVTYVMSARSCISRSKMKILSLNALVCILQIILGSQFLVLCIRLDLNL